MATIQLTIPDQQLSLLQSKAELANLTIDELLQQTIEEFLSGSLETEKAMEYVLKKNGVLYERLA